MSLRERIDLATDVAVLTIGFFFVGWYYYELYQAFHSSSLGF